MKILAILLLFFSNAFNAEGQIPKQEKMNAMPSELIVISENQDNEYTVLDHILIECSNAFEWKLSCDFKKATVSFIACGMNKEAWQTFLYDSEHLFYRPEFKNNQVDFTSSGIWEFRFSVLMDFQKIFFTD